MDDDQRPISMDLNAPAAPLRYHAFLINADGLVLQVAKLPAANDSEALSRAEALVDGHAVELWDGIRFIEHFPPKKPSTD